MSEWFAPACWQLAPEAELALGIISAVLALLVLALIILGFGPLRAWLGMADAHRSPRSCSVDSDSGLVAIWRLYRRLRCADPPTAPFCMPAVPGLMVPDDVGDMRGASGTGGSELPTDLPDGRPMAGTIGLLATFEQTKLM